MKVAQSLCADDTRTVNYVEKVFRAVDKGAEGTRILSVKVRSSIVVCARRVRLSPAGLITLEEFQEALARLGVNPQVRNVLISFPWHNSC